MIALVHFGGQYAHLIERAVNERGVSTLMLEPDQISEDRPEKIQGVILSGSPESVNDKALAVARSVLSWNLPVLGICFGHHLLGVLAGGRITHQEHCEYGRATFTLGKERSRLTGNFPSQSQVWMSHGDTLTELPNGEWAVLGQTEGCPIAAIANEKRRLYGVQFHPEVTHTHCGDHVFEDFLADICRCAKDYQPGQLFESVVAQIRHDIGDTGHVMVACSLGVDSTTAAFLYKHALGVERVHPVYINNGLQRAEDLVIVAQARKHFPTLEVVNAEAEFLTALRGVGDREEKRRVIGEMFWTTFMRVVSQLKERFPLTAFTQGTIAPDVIESGRESSAASTIKTHHNLVPRPTEFPLPLFEPLRKLYKDQVRALGRESGVPQEILSRHPFPGPGLAVRVMGLVTPERISIVRECDRIFIEELRRHGYYDTASQAFVVLQSDMPSCVRGDERATGWPVTLRAVHTRDFMTADIWQPPLSFLAGIANKILNTVRGVARVTYDLTPKPPGTIEWE